MKIEQKKERRDGSQKAIEILANILMGLFPDCDRARNLDQCNSDDYDILSAISSGILWSKVFHIPICIQYDLFRGYDPCIYGCEDIGTD